MQMLNYIIPPIIIVLSLAALVVFLFRKSAKIPEELISKEKLKDARDNRPDKKKLFRFTQLILRLTEKGMQYSKLFSLKFYNKTDNWFHSLKEKREKRSEIGTGMPQTFNNPEPPKPYQETIIINKQREIKVDHVIVKQEDEVEIEPMISKEVVHPDPRAGAKNEFERALIERIAFNPRDIEAYERLGDYYIEVGNLNDSLACFEEVLKLSPVNRRIKIKVRRLQKIVFSKSGR
jgi:tetratricopeptide (TPR) repeat protein